MHISHYQELLKFQNNINSTISPDWIEDDYGWDRGLRQKVAKAIDFCSWTWWKKTLMDFENLSVELVDIFHFILSLQLIDPEVVPLEEFVTTVAKGYSSIDQRETRSNLDLIDGLEAMSFASYKVDRESFLEILHQWGKTWALTGQPMDSLYIYYMSKNVLRKFRLDNGYKTGTYIKTWGINKKSGPLEDSVICWDIIADLMSENNNDMSFLPILLERRLAKEYNKVLKTGSDKSVTLPERSAIH